jgi:hypothetical protein
MEKGTRGQERFPLMACLRLEGEENLGTWLYREKICKIVYVKDYKHFRARSERGSQFFFVKY